MRMVKRLNRFNMIEIVLAIGIAAFGIMAVVAMIPPALNANRDVAADAFVDEAVSKMKLLVNVFYVPSANWTAMIGGDSNANSPTASTVSNLASLGKGDNAFKSTTYPNAMREWNIFVTSAPNVFYLESADSTVAAHAVVWKQSIEPIYCGPGVTPVSASYDDGARINIEISWPVNVKQENRQRRTVSFDVFKK